MLGAAQIVTGPAGQRGAPRGVPGMTLETDVFKNRPTFRAGVTRVEVSVRVVDADGRPVRGLVQSDFEVLQDGRPQTIASFVPYSFTPGMLEVDPLSASSARSPGAFAAATAPVSNAWTSESRVFAILIDDLHIDARHTSRARQIARHFVEQLDPSDLLLVGLTSGQVTTGSFSRDRRRALALIDEASGQRLPDPTMEMLRMGKQSYFVGAGQPNPALLGSQQQRVMQLDQAYEAIAHVAASVAHLPARRKTLLFISEGSPVGAGSGLGGSGSAHNAQQQAVAAATMADLAVYPINPIGIDTPTDRLIEVRVRQVDDQGAPVAHEDLTNILAQHRQAKIQLRDVADLTGGVSLIDTNDLEGAVDRMIRDASDHYLLSYEPDQPIKDGRMRKLQVKVSRPGVRVLARHGYMAPGVWSTRDVRTPSGVSPALQGLLSDIVPADGLGIRAQVVPLVQRKGKTLLAVIAEVDGAALAASVDRGRIAVEQGLFTLDDKGKTSNATRRQMNIRVNDQQLTVLSASALRTVWAIELAPGEHQLRLAAVDEQTGRGGSLYLDLRVDAAQPPQGIAVASRALSMVPTAFMDRDIARLLPAPPTAMRLFPPDDTLQVTVSGVVAGGELQVQDEVGIVQWQAQIAGDVDALAHVDVPLAALPAGWHRMVVKGTGGADQAIVFAVVHRSPSSQP